MGALIQLRDLAKIYQSGDSEFAALRAHALVQCVALLLQLPERRLLARHPRFDLAQAAVGLANLLVGIAQLARRAAALVLDGTPLGGHRLELLLDLLQLALGVAAVLRDGRRPPAGRRCPSTRPGR